MPAVESINLIWIVLIIAITIVVVLFMFRDRLTRFFFQADKEGIKTGLEAQHHLPQTPTPPGVGVVISGNRQTGEGHTIDVGRPNVQVQDNVQEGQNQEIIVRPENASASTSGPTTTNPAQAQRMALRHFLGSHFNQGELRNLCFDFGFDYESLPGDGTADKVREIVTYCERHGRLAELETYCRQHRPGIPW